jgi:hypothetical protein
MPWPAEHAVAGQHGEVDRGARPRQGGTVGTKRRISEIRGGAQHLDRRWQHVAALERRQADAAVAGNHRGHPLRNLCREVRLDQRRQVVVRMHVDEPRRDGQTGGIDPPVRAPAREGADRRDTRALDGQIAAESRPARAIDDQSPFDDQMAPARGLARLLHALTRAHRLFPCLDRPVSYGQGCHAI